jgi:hypothetical protein
MRYLLLFVLLFSQVHAEYQVCISEMKIWMNADGSDPQYLFTLSDGMCWMTNSELAYESVALAGWSVDDHLTIQPANEGWLVSNHERNSSLLLMPLCNKGNNYPHHLFEK